MCAPCRGLWFRRLSQIIAEGIKDEPAKMARGIVRTERLLPENGPRDGVHKTWYKTSNAAELARCHRVATKLGLTFDYVRSVVRGIRHSEAVVTALREDKE
jgi:hypothetical protein